MTVAVRLHPAITSQSGITHHVTVPLQHDVYAAARKYAREQGINLETALAEAGRSYFLGDKE